PNSSRDWRNDLASVGRALDNSLPETGHRVGGHSSDRANLVGEEGAYSAGRVLLLISLCSLAAISPLLFLGYHKGHDFEAHLSSWMDASQQFRQFVLIPRW